MSCERLYQVDTPLMKGAPCFGLIVENGLVKEAAPFAYWAKGKTIEHVARYFVAKGATIIEVDR